MHTISSPGGGWLRTDREAVRFGFDPDELATEVEESTDVIHADELPTVAMDVRSIGLDEIDTRTDIRRHARMPEVAPVAVHNRAQATPIAPPDRDEVPPHVRGWEPQALRVERPLPATYNRAPVSITVEDPVPLEPLYTSWTFADEYGWWLAGVISGAFVGSVIAAMSLFSAVYI